MSLEVRTEEDADAESEAAARGPKGKGRDSGSPVASRRLARATRELSSLLGIA